MYDAKIEERVDREIASFLEDEYATQGDGLYQWYRHRFLAANNKYLPQTIGLAHYDKAIARFVLERCAFAKRFVEVGAGLAQESFLVALHGLPTFAVEGTLTHLEMMNRLRQRLAAKLDSGLVERMTPINDWFPRHAAEYVNADTVLVFPTLSTTMTEEEETQLLDALKLAGGVILSTEHFLRNRSADEQTTLISQIRSRGFDEPVEVFSWANGDMGFTANRIFFLKRCSLGGRKVRKKTRAPRRN